VRRAHSGRDLVRHLPGRSECHRGSLGLPPGDRHERLLPAYQVGEEFAADGTYYALVPGGNGTLTRDVDSRSIGTWEVKLGDHGVLEVHTYGNYVQRTANLSACPRALDTIGLEVPAP